MELKNNFNIKFKNIFALIIHTIKHKFWVFIYILKFCFKMLWRAICHDISKFSLVEFNGFVKHIHKFKHAEYGSKRYNQLLDEIRPSLDHHYRCNSHHAEYYNNDMQKCNLYDIVEMFFDWQASIKKNPNGNMHKSIKVNKKKYNISKQLTNVFLNTVNKNE